MLAAIIAATVVTVAMILICCFQQEKIVSLNATNDYLSEENRSLKNRIKLMQEVDDKWRD